MTIHTLDKAVAGLLILFGLWLIATGFGYGVLQGYTPGPGLFPVLMGGLIASLSVVNLLRALGGVEKLAPGMSRREIVKTIGVIVVMVAAILLVEPIGMVLATMLAMGAIGLILRSDPSRAFLVRLAAVSLATPLVCWWLFDGLLRVPVPPGPFGF